MLKNQTSTRNSAIELLRVISMIMIVFHHFAAHGDFKFEADFSMMQLWFNFIIMGGKIGVNVFVLISGYYLIDKKSCDICKIIKFVGQVLFYSIIILLVSRLTGVADWDIKSIIKAFFPITFSEWWFASTYFVLYLLHPFLNKLLHNLDKALYQKLILLLVVCWSIIPTFTTSLFQSNSLLWFVTLYVISGYIRLYGLNEKFTTRHYFIFYIIFSILTYSSSIVIPILGKHISGLPIDAIYFYGQEKLTTLLISLSLFMCFATLKMNYHKWINILASATFGVYLIHDNNIIRHLLWLNWFDSAQYQNSLLLIPYSIIVVIVVYVSCSLIDLFRQFIIEKPCMKIVKKNLSKFLVPLKKFASMLKSLIFGK